MYRALFVSLLMLAPMTNVSAAEAPATNFDGALQAMLEKSRDAKQGLVFYVDANQIPGRVIEILPDAVVVTNQTHGRVVIRLERIDAVAAN